MNLDGICIVFSLTALFFTWWLVSNVRRRPRRATRSGHDVTGPGFNMYLPKAKACLATRFGSTDVAADGRPSEKQAAAGQLAGGGAVNAHEAGHCAASESCARGRLEVKVFDGQKVVICCEESERDPVHSASLEERKRSNSLRHVSLLSEINQQLKQEFGRIAMKRRCHVHVIQTCFCSPLIRFRCFADKP